MRITCGAPGGSAACARIGRGDHVHHHEGRRGGAPADLQRSASVDAERRGRRRAGRWPSRRSLSLPGQIAAASDHVGPARARAPGPASAGRARSVLHHRRRGGERRALLAGAADRGAEGVQVLRSRRSRRRAAAAARPRARRRAGSRCRARSGRCRTDCPSSARRPPRCPPGPGSRSVVEAGSAGRRARAAGRPRAAPAGRRRRAPARGHAPSARAPAPHRSAAGFVCSTAKRGRGGQPAIGGRRQEGDVVAAVPQRERGGTGRGSAPRRSATVCRRRRSGDAVRDAAAPARPGRSRPRPTTRICASVDAEIRLDQLVALGERRAVVGEHGAGVRVGEQRPGDHVRGRARRRARRGTPKRAICSAGAISVSNGRRP